MNRPVYAKGTGVSAKSSRDEIERILERYGAKNFGYTSDATKAAIEFHWKDRRIRFILPLEVKGNWRQSSIEQIQRERWRALVLAIKAKCETVHSEIKSIDEEFLNEIVLPNGRTVGDSIRWAVEDAYKTGLVPNILLALPAPPDRPAIEDDNVIDILPESGNG
jgi:hypothetical protein